MADTEILCHQCPKCLAKGTYGCYPAIPDAPERWMCKWCGYYWSEKFGERQCVPDPGGFWNFRENVAEGGLLTPKERWPEAHVWLLHSMGVS